MLVLPADVRSRLVAHCIASLPHEGCGLLVGEPDAATVRDAIGTPNAAGSALVYEIDPRDQLVIDRGASAQGLEVIGAFHSHTHTDAWPSPTDVAAAVDPSWHWVIVSLRHADPVLKSFLIARGAIEEEAVAITEE